MEGVYKRLVRLPWRRGFVALSSAGLLLRAPLAAGEVPWPQWRGPARDGVARTFDTPRAWPDHLTKRWSVPVGIGYATPLLAGDRLFLFTRQQGEEVMLALRAGTGETLWRTAYRAPVTLNQRSGSFRHGEGPKSTPTYADGRLFTMGMGGIVSAFDAATGRLLWQKAPPAVLPLYGTATSPLVDGDRVIVHTGGHDQGALVAFDVRTGEERWQWSGDGPAYGSPVLATLDGVRQVIGVSQQFVIGVDAGSGSLLWKRPFLPPNTTSSQTPIVLGRTVLISGQSMGVTAFAPRRGPDGWTSETVWENPDVSMYMSNGVVIAGVLYGLSHKNSGQWFALDASTGKTLWLTRGREAANAAIVGTGAFLVQLKDDGELLVTPADRQGHAPVRRYQVADSATWAQPVLDGRRIFIKDEDHLTLWTLP